MKKLVVAVAASGLFATPAMAQVTETIDVDAEVTVVCEVSDLNTVVNFGELGRRGQAPRVRNGGVDAFCNQPSTVSLTSTNGFLKLNSNTASTSDEQDFLSDANGGLGQFAAGLDYQATVFGLTGDTSDLTANTAVTFGAVPPLNLRNVAIIYDTIAGPLPLIGGDYSDTLLISLTPNGV